MCSGSQGLRWADRRWVESYQTVMLLCIFPIPLYLYAVGCVVGLGSHTCLHTSPTEGPTAHPTHIRGCWAAGVKVSGDTVEGEMEAPGCGPVGLGGGERPRPTTAYRGGDAPTLSLIGGCVR